MKAAVITYPGSNCDRDLARGFELAGFAVTRVWHKDLELPSATDVVGVPGGFSFGDYLRCGAIAAHSPISAAVKAHAGRGGYVLGLCNGFQVLCEMGLLPGVLMRNAGLTYIGKTVALQVATAQSAFTSAYRGRKGALNIPIAHHEGNYTIDDAGLKTLQDQDRIAFRYLQNPNGARDDIAGVLSQNRRVLGMMPHPERACEAAHGSLDGAPFFASLLEAHAPA